MHGRKRVQKDALRQVLAAAEQSVDCGRYPSVDLALFEMAANQRRANRAGVDIHNLIRQHERDKGTDV